MILHNCGVVILAAGASQRMGTPKQLLEFRGQSFIRHSIQVALLSGFSSLVVVLGANATSIVKDIKGLPIPYIINDIWENGMGNSISHGVRYLIEKNPDLEGILIMLCDQPYLQPEDLKIINDTFLKNQDSIVATEYEVKAGVPAIFPKELFHSLINLNGKQGAKDIILNFDKVVPVKIPTKNLMDIDTPEDYKNLN